MKLCRCFSCFLCFVLLCAGSFYWSFPSRDSHVILISIDGLAAYHLENRDLEFPNIRELIETGVWAQSSQTVFPSVTHPSHTTLITGVSPRVHGVIGNRMKNRKTGESFHISNKPRAESIKVETLFDAAKKKGLTTAAFFWPETKDDPSIDYNIPEVFGEDGLADITASNPHFLRELRQAGVPIDLYFHWYGQRFLRGAADVLLTRAAGYTIEKYKPHILVIHILVTDVMQHSYGPGHYLSQTALTIADHCVGILREAVERAGISETTTFLITADHGFHTVKYDLDLSSLFEESGLLNRVTLHPHGWTLFVELGENFNPEKDSALLEGVFRRALALKEISKIIRPEEFRELGYPKYEEDPHVPGQFIIVSDIDTHFSDDGRGQALERVPKETPYHGHGYLPTHPRMYPAFVASGYRIKRGERIGHISNYNVAPTISLLLDLEMSGLKGRVLKEALTRE